VERGRGSDEPTMYFHAHIVVIWRACRACRLETKQRTGNGGKGLPRRSSGGCTAHDLESDGLCASAGWRGNPMMPPRREGGSTCNQRIEVRHACEDAQHDVGAR